LSNDQVLKEKIISKAWEDNTFKEELLINPKAAMKKSFDVEFPEDIQVSALSETSRKFYLVIPPAPTNLKSKEPKEHPMWQ
jgi:hypothetical protein